MCEERDMAQLIIKRPNEVQDKKLEMNKPEWFFMSRIYLFPCYHIYSTYAIK